MNTPADFPRFSRVGQRFLILAACVGVALGGFLWASQTTWKLGFPLDDAWIHQTYARNLAQSGEWAFNPGRPSAGSTAPLWSLLLTIGYWLRLDPRFWAYLLGGLALLGTAWLGEGFVRHIFPSQARSIPWVGIFLAGEWHLVWASGSGMETLLFAGVILLLFWLLSRKDGSPLWAGLICGLCIWIRPDGLTLAGPLGFVFLWQNPNWKTRVKAALLALGGCAMAAAPYFLFNLVLSGNAWPNTFYAKQAEYAIRQQTPYLLRFVQLISLPLVGAGITLAPGFLACLWLGWIRKQWVILAAVLWWVGYTALYAAFLPVDYQHGRYLMPAMPVYFVLGLAGSRELLGLLTVPRLQRPVRLAFVSVVGLTWMLFYIQGALAYARDVAIIETEMVASANWVSENIQPGALVAAHDIGALGYFGRHRVLDLAGLVTPEVIPFIRDEANIASFMDQQGASYLLTFPGWYPDLVKRAVLIYQSQGKFSPMDGGENMGVYRWVEK